MKEEHGIYSKPGSDNPNFYQRLIRKKPVEKSLAEATSNKTLKWYDLAAYGIAATVGSGIYVTVGKVAKDCSGPAVILSTLIAGILSLLTGVCYLEFASALPISGSGYAYFYALMGEFLGWFIGWNLTLEYGFAAALIAEGWATYLVSLLASLGLSLPIWMYNVVPLEKLSLFGYTLVEDFGIFRINIIAGLVILLLGYVVSRGARFGTMLTNTVTILNISTILFIIAAGSMYVKPANWTPFIPSVSGVFTGGGHMFFSFIGYDTVSTLAAEAINPSRDIPIAIILTVGVATGLYMLVGLVITGMVPYQELDATNSLTRAFLSVNASWAYYIIGVMALLMMASTMFACLVGQPKIFQAIAKDGLIPRSFARENAAGTPMFSVTASTILLAIVATFVSGESIEAMVTFGTLFAMSTLCAGVLIVRFDGRKESKPVGIALTTVYLFGSLISSWCAHECSFPIQITTSVLLMGLPFLGLVFYFAMYSSQLRSSSKAFSCPLMPLIPCMAIAANSYVMMSLTPVGSILAQFLVWTFLGFIVYFAYGIRHSHLGPTLKHAA